MGIKTAWGGAMLFALVVAIIIQDALLFGIAFAGAGGLVIGVLPVERL